MARLRIRLLIIAIFALAWSQSSALEPHHESGFLPIDPPTPFVHYLEGNQPLGRVLVVHGLDVSKELMQLVSKALVDGGFEVYAIDLPGHGDSPLRFRADLAEQAVRNVRAFVGEKTIVLGHSLGAGLLLDLAATDQFSTMVLLSPPPLSVPQIHADRVLIATGVFDIPRIRSFVPIAADIGSPHVESWLLPWAGHAAPIFNPRYIRRIVEWLGGSGQKTKTESRIFWMTVMLTAALAFGAALMPGGKVERIELPATTVLVHYIVCCAGAIVVLKFVNPLVWLRLFATDYLIGFLFLAGLLLVAGFTVGAKTKSNLTNGSIPNPQFSSDGSGGSPRMRIADWRIEPLVRFCLRPYSKAILAAAFVIAVPGFLVLPQILHVSLNDGRWWRFPCIALAGLPLFISDEITLRRMRPRWKSEGAALLTRALLIAFLFTGVLIFNRESGFLVLLVPVITAFWIALWYAAGVVHRHTRSPMAAALFAAIVQGWAFAAWFVTI